MCGIAGWQFRKGVELSPEQRKVLMSFLITAMDMRGGDSWGYVKLGVDNKLNRWRGLGTATGHMRLPEVSKSRQVMFHARKRTHGEVSINNAHPFLQGHILGAHNGIVSNHDELNRKYDRSFQVDSQQIFQHLSDGLDVGEISLYGAISYIDVNKPEKLMICKCSSGGDLEVYGIGPNKENCIGIVYASTKAPITNALLALRLPYFSYTINAQELYYLEDGMLYTTNSKLEFGSNTVSGGFRRQGYDTSFSYRGGIYRPREGFSPCKKCRKHIKHANIFYNLSLCGKCQGRLKSVEAEDNRLAAERRGYLGVGRTPAWECCEQEGCLKAGTGVKDVNGKYWCPEHAASRYQQAVREAGAVITSELKGGDGGTDGATTFCPDCLFTHAAGEGNCGEARSSSLVSHVVDGSVVPEEPCLDSWDLCGACIQYREINGLQKKVIQDDFCRTCRHKWDSMVTDLKGMTNEEKDLFVPVTWCMLCGKTPCFGRRRGDGSKLVACLACRAREVQIASERRAANQGKHKCYWCSKVGIIQSYTVKHGWHWWCSAFCRNRYEQTTEARKQELLLEKAGGVADTVLVKDPDPLELPTVKGFLSPCLGPMPVPPPKEGAC